VGKAEDVTKNSSTARSIKISVCQKLKAKLTYLLRQCCLHTSIEYKGWQQYIQ